MLSSRPFLSRESFPQFRLALLAIASRLVMRMLGAFQVDTKELRLLTRAVYLCVEKTVSHSGVLASQHREKGRRLC